jgi:hypothetical protein
VRIEYKNIHVNIFSNFLNISKSTFWINGGYATRIKSAFPKNIFLICSNYRRVVVTDCLLSKLQSVTTTGENFMFLTVMLWCMFLKLQCLLLTSGSTGKHQFAHWRLQTSMTHGTFFTCSYSMCVGASGHAMLDIARRIWATQWWFFHADDVSGSETSFSTRRLKKSRENFVFLTAIFLCIFLNLQCMLLTSDRPIVLVRLQIKLGCNLLGTFFTCSYSTCVGASGQAKFDIGRWIWATRCSILVDEYEPAAGIGVVIRGWNNNASELQATFQWKHSHGNTVSWQLFSLQRVLLTSDTDGLLVASVSRRLLMKLGCHRLGTFRD